MSMPRSKKSTSSPLSQMQVSSCYKRTVSDNQAFIQFWVDEFKSYLYPILYCMWPYYSALLGKNMKTLIKGHVLGMRKLHSYYKWYFYMRQYWNSNYQEYYQYFFFIFTYKWCMLKIYKPFGLTWLILFQTYFVRDT